MLWKKKKPAKREGADISVSPVVPEGPILLSEPIYSALALSSTGYRGLPCYLSFQHWALHSQVEFLSDQLSSTGATWVSFQFI